MSILQSLRANFSPTAIAASLYNFGEKSIGLMGDYWDSSTLETKNSAKKAALIAPAILALSIGFVACSAACAKIDPFLGTPINMFLSNSALIGSIFTFHLGVSVYMLACEGTNNLFADPLLEEAPDGQLEEVFHPAQGLPEEMHSEVLGVAHEGA